MLSSKESIVSVFLNTISEMLKRVEVVIYQFKKLVVFLKVATSIITQYMFWNDTKKIINCEN